MNNFQRGDTAERALNHIGYPPPSETKGNKLPLPDGGEKITAEGYGVSDLVADLCHLLQRHDIDIEDTISAGITHYAADVIEQAFQNSEDWSDILQDEENLDRARMVMRSAGVPEQFEKPALVFVGLLPPELED